VKSTRRRGRGIVVIAVATVGLAFTVNFGTASAATQYVKHVATLPTPLQCQLAAELNQAATGHSFWCDGVDLFELV
jgi:hypothetical protein